MNIKLKIKVKVSIVNKRIYVKNYQKNPKTVSASPRGSKIDGSELAITRYTNTPRGRGIKPILLEIRSE